MKSRKAFKKAQSLVQNKVVWAIILLFSAAVIFFVFFAPKGLLSKIADQASSAILKSQPQKKSEGLAGQINVPKEIKGPFDSLASAFKSGQQSQNTGCFLEYDEIYDLDGHKIELLSEEGLNLRIIMPNGQTTPVENIVDLEPCIVGGKDGDRIAAQNFYRMYIDAEIEITGDGKLYTGHKRLVISEDGSTKDSEIEPGEYDMNDAGLKNSAGKEINLLFKADKNHICFFVTNDVYNYDAGGIEEDFIHDIYWGRNTAENYAVPVIGTTTKTGGSKMQHC